MRAILAAGVALMFLSGCHGARSNASAALATHDLCDRADLSYLIGKPRTQIPVAADLTRRRVACTTCPVSNDYKADRTDILYDAQTGRVTTLICG